MAQKEAIAAALSIARRAKKAAGGSAATVSWQQRASSRGLSFAGGMIKSAVPGRTDKLNLNVPAGAYVLPADVPSALGQGNTMAGGKILNQMFSVGMNRPARVRPPRLSFGRRGRGMFAVGGPAIDPLQGGGAPPPAPAMPPAAGGMPGAMPQAMPPAGMPPGMPGMVGPPGMMGGMPGAMPGMPPDMAAAQPMLPPATTAEPEPDSGLPMPDHAAMAEPEAPAEAQSEEVPIIAAGGEYVIPPEKVQEIGGGDLDRGHEILDAFVKLVRKQHVKTLRKLPPPKVN